MTALLASIRGLLAYTIWADRQILQALEEVPAEDLARDTGTSFGSVLGTMAHILGAEQVWLSRFLGVPLQALPSIEDFPDLAALRSSWEDFWPQLEVFLASLSEDQLGRDLHWTSFSGQDHTAPLRQALLHVVNHSTYHRGQVVAQLRQLGRSAPSTDLVYWRGSL
jgi:uncharacterized damage-inducible protein DinB